MTDYREVRTQPVDRPDFEDLMIGQPQFVVTVHVADFTQVTHQTEQTSQCPLAIHRAVLPVTVSLEQGNVAILKSADELCIFKTIVFVGEESDEGQQHNDGLVRFQFLHGTNELEVKFHHLRRHELLDVLEIQFWGEVVDGQIDAPL